MLFYCLLFYELLLLLFKPLIRNLTDVRQVAHHTQLYHSIYFSPFISIMLTRTNIHIYTHSYIHIYTHSNTYTYTHTHNSQFVCSTLMSIVQKICSSLKQYFLHTQYSFTPDLLSLYLSFLTQHTPHPTHNTALHHTSPHHTPPRYTLHVTLLYDCDIN